MSDSREESINKIAAAVSVILTEMGEDVSRPDLTDTPVRFAKFMLAFSPKKEKPKITTFETDSTGLVVVTGLEVRSICAHHLAPFIGEASVAYYPNKRKAGLSKFQRALDYVANKPQDQENLTLELLNFLVEEIKPKSMLVKVVATHTCMSVRGVRCHGAQTSTLETYGDISDTELLAILHILK